MALMDCPDCGRTVSRSAVACPDCAYPVGKAGSGGGIWNAWRIVGTILIVPGIWWMFIWVASTRGWIDYETDIVQLFVGALVVAVGIGCWTLPEEDPVGSESAGVTDPFAGKDWVLGKEWDKQGDEQVVRCLDCNWDVYFPSGMSRHGDHHIELPPANPSGVWTEPTE